MESQWKLSALGRKNRDQNSMNCFELYKGVLVDEAVKVSSFDDLANIFEKTFVNQFSRRKEGDTFDSAEREAWMAEVVHIKSSQVKSR
jgi:hypothetical protein